MPVPAGRTWRKGKILCGRLYLIDGKKNVEQ